MKKINTFIALFSLMILFTGAVLLNNTFLAKFRVDLTEDKVYSLSQGTKNIIRHIEEPVHFYFFFSEANSEGMTQIRNYAQRVRSLLEEYVLLSQGKIKLHQINPEPFSEAEDKAAEFGLTAAPVNAIGDNLYFGLGARNSLDETQTIAFFDPAKETFLEYDISKLLQQLIEPNPIKVSVLSGLPVSGGHGAMTNPMMGMHQPQPAWVFYQQLEQMYEVELLAEDADTLPTDTDVLLLINPSDVSQDMQFAIDQYLINGGKALIFADPLSESAGPMASPAGDLFDLLAKWGVSVTESEVVIDSALGLEVRMPSGITGKHYAILGLTQDNINRQDAVSAQLESINLASVGSVKAAEQASFKFEPILFSSEYANLTGSEGLQMQMNPEDLQKGFQPSGAIYNIAARVSGSLTSAFADDKNYNQNAGFKSQTQSAQFIVIADSDLLADQYWVQTSQFFGQMIATPFANNGDLVANMVENLGGSNDLISIRARGKFSRPFSLVEALEIKAQEKFRQQQEQLEQRLTETENQLAQIQGEQTQSNQLVLSDEQEAMIESYIDEKLKIRKALREVQHKLNKDIDELGSWLKFINIAVAPVVLTFVLFLFSLMLKRRKLV